MQAVLTRAFARRLSKDYAVRSLFSTNANAEGANKRVRKATTIRPDLHNISHHVDLPPEKFSLSSGLALNRFEKDFVIYPEYSDADSAARIKSFTEKLRNELCEALTKTMPSDGILPDPVSAVLKRNALSTIYVPDEYGGMGMCNKDLLCISEVLGIDFNVYMALTQIQLVVNAITVYGTQQQKEDLLPKIASGELRPAICLFDDNGNFDFTSMRTTSTVCGDGMEKISGHKNVVIGAADANLLLIFANRKSPLQPSGCLVCYVVDKDSLPNGAVTVTSRLRTLGLHALHLSNVELRDVSVTSANVLGSGADGHDIALELSASNSFTYGAAVVGFLKSLTAELVRFCNTTVQYNALLSENRGVQHVFTELCLATFVLESMSYYIGGLLDEELVVSTDIETAVIHVSSIAIYLTSFIVKRS
ncbi:Acyl-CoA dehydrogenase family member 9, mitochondrial [Toxocara canis]|uniref:Acyl-CoA dehydrogenase family member 9, mitochondrial n=1 Tax=Toxocara canis TaxID=6265 RepID=A0A0B2VW39_TOXCA|nr:Acyl-CoA dehydrogenase family member 9, mitochondrial [Toxocara canis]